MLSLVPVELMPSSLLVTANSALDINPTYYKATTDAIQPSLQRLNSPYNGNAMTEYYNDKEILVNRAEKFI